MEPFVTHAGRAVPLRRSNVDTDQIIPAVYLKRVTRTGFEDGLFTGLERTQPVWPLSVRCSSACGISNILIVWSRLPVIRYLASGVKVMAPIQ